MKAPRHPQFRWQALLILLPVALLTALGLVSLGRDRRLAEEDARDLAGRLAQDFADRAAATLSTGRPGAGSAATEDIRFDVSTNLALLSPTPFDRVPVPQPWELSELGDAAQVEWQTARNPGSDRGEAIAAWERFLRQPAPDRLLAEAGYQLAELQLQAGETNHALAAFARVAARSPELAGESGLPLPFLARWRLTELEGRIAGGQASAEAIAQTAAMLVEHPSALTPLLLPKLGELASPASRDAVARSEQRWADDELVRAIHRAAVVEWRRAALGLDTTDHRAERGARAPVWIELDASSIAGSNRSRRWLVTQGTNSTSFRARDEVDVLRDLTDARRRVSGIPAYCDLTVTIAGRTLPAPSPYPQLATRTSAGPEGSSVASSSVIAMVHLTDPARLFAHQRQRAWWFGALVLAAAAVAIGGLVATRRAFRRQVRLNELKSNFVSSVSHELRAPIASVRLLAEGLERGTVTEPARRQEYFRLIVQECRRLGALIENVLDFSRIDQGRKQYEFEATDLAALVRHTVSLMEPYAGERQVTLATTLPAPDAGSASLLPMVDGRALQQALVNLIDNAVKHSPAGAGVEIALEFARDGEHGCRLAVTDHGPGIPAADRERIFEPFHRLGSELRRETPGVGIGLSIVKHIVDAHGGRVWVEETPGGGSRFVIALAPAAAPPALTATNRS